MSTSGVVQLVAAICIIWSVVSYVLPTGALGRRGVNTPVPFMGAFLFRNLHRYSELTREESGKVGVLFWSYVVPINVTLVLMVALALARAVR